MFYGSQCKQTHPLAIACYGTLSLFSFLVLCFALQKLRFNFNWKVPGKQMFCFAFLSSSACVGGIVVLCISKLWQSINIGWIRLFQILDIVALNILTILSVMSLSTLSLLWYEATVPKNKPRKHLVFLRQTVARISFSYSVFAIIIACVTNNWMFSLIQCFIYEIVFTIGFFKSSKMLAKKLLFSTTQLNFDTLQMPTFISVMRRNRKKKTCSNGIFTHAIQNINLETRDLQIVQMSSLHHESESEEKHPDLQIKDFGTDNIKYKVHPLQEESIGKENSASIMKQKTTNSDIVVSRVKQSIQQILLWLAIKVLSTFGKILSDYFPESSPCSCVLNVVMFSSLLMVHVIVLQYSHRPARNAIVNTRRASISVRLRMWKKNYSSQRSIVYSAWRKSCRKSVARSSRKSLVSSFWRRNASSQNRKASCSQTNNSLARSIRVRRHRL